ncbi:MAG: NAD(P)/FAD-dependent oxidoreductase [Anaerolineales bacterium]|nr:NAD(P)/FAD-dependent oxidoreductase [Anaerolineales bacterium]
MDEKTILIIGGGIAGLAAGCYAQLNGYRAQIFELHSLPGGLCTAWERKDYVFDGCIHYLFGTGAGQPFHRMWEELGLPQNWRIINHDEMMRLTDGSGRTLIVYTDPDRLGAHMKELSPVDAPFIDDFIQGVYQFTQFDLSKLVDKPRAIMKGEDWLAFNKAVLPYSLPLARWGMVSAGNFARRFHDPLLRRAIAHMFAWPEIPVMIGMFLLAYSHIRNAGFPAGASLEFARSLERRYLELGGQIHYRAQVEKILTEPVPGQSKRHRVVGVRLYDDRIIHGDYVISAADGRGTIFDMLDGRFTNRSLRRMYDGHLQIHSQIQVSLGVNRDLSDQPHWVTYLLDEPILIAGEEHREINVKHYCFDPSLAPPGKSAVVLMMPSKYAYWQRIYGRALYDSEQHQVSDILIDFLEKIYPGIRQDIEVVDEATPLSYERYTGNWQGSSCGWLPTTGTMLMMVKGLAKTLPRLDNFYLAGQWVEPGGTVPIAAMSGRNAVQLICHQDDKPFIIPIRSG